MSKISVTEKRLREKPARPDVGPYEPEMIALKKQHRAFIKTAKEEFNYDKKESCKMWRQYRNHVVDFNSTITAREYLDAQDKS